MSKDLVELVPDGVLAVDVEGCITFANPATEEITGYSRPELLGAAFASLLHARDPHGQLLFSDDWHASARLRSTRLLPEQAVTLRTKAGVDVATSLSGSYVRGAEGELSGAVLCLRRRCRNHVPEIAGIEIVSTVSHELRSPLTSIKGYTSLMLNRWDRLHDEQKQMMLEQINHDADRVTRLITELLDVSRLESGRLVPKRQLVDLPCIIATVLETVRLAYPTLSCESAFPPDFPKVYADPDKIEQVVTNLVENSCKYASPEGLRISGAVRGDQVSVEVRDRGKGIPATDLPRVFNKFFRRDAGRPTGSGLGLWISRGLIECHGGELSAESTPGRGSAFRFTLPMVELDRLQEP